MVAAHTSHSSSSGEWIACLDKRYRRLHGSGCGGMLCACMRACMHACVCVCVPVLTPPRSLSDPALHKERPGGRQKCPEEAAPGRRGRRTARHAPGSGGDGQSLPGRLLSAGLCCPENDARGGGGGAPGRGEGAAARGPGVAGRGPAVPAVADPLLAAFAPQSALRLVAPHLTLAHTGPGLASPQHTALRLASPHGPAPHLSTPPPFPPAQPPHRLGGKGQTLASERSVRKQVRDCWPEGVRKKCPPRKRLTGFHRWRQPLLPAEASWGPEVVTQAGR